MLDSIYTSQDDTICAIATANGRGAIAIIRITGKNSLSILKKIFVPAKKRNIDDIKGFSLVFGSVMDGKKLIDEVLISLFRNPNSYTGEDLIEISCHASPFIQQEILKLILANGARIAKPGEFTSRAYFNGRLDLSQAEAIGDLIASTSAAAHKLAISQMRGGYSQELAELREKLLHFVSMIELELDFSEEDVEFANRDEMKILCINIHERISKLVQSFAYGNAIKNGVPVAIVGEPNVGKSTLLNALLNEEKAIVSEIPGTTRDVIEDVMQLDGIGFRFIDTAGIRKTTDIIETLGIKKTFEKIEQAAIVLLLADVSSTIKKINTGIEGIKKHLASDKPVFVLINKIDFLAVEKAEDRFNKSNFPLLTDRDKLIFISAKKAKNLDVLRAELVQEVQNTNTGQDDIVVTNLRHFEALSQAHAAIEKVNSGLENGLSHDLLALELRQVLHYLGEITGAISNDEMLGYIFGHFCIGK